MFISAKQCALAKAQLKNKATVLVRLSKYPSLNIRSSPQYLLVQTFSSTNSISNECRYVIFAKPVVNTCEILNIPSSANIRSLLSATLGSPVAFVRSYRHTGSCMNSMI
jgi:hypothetical protein